MARDLDFYGWVMYQLHAAARTQHTTPSFMGFWPVPNAPESSGCLLVPILPLPHRTGLIGELVRPGYWDIPTGRLWPYVAQVSFLGPGLFVRENTEAI